MFMIRYNINIFLMISYINNIFNDTACLQVTLVLLSLASSASETLLINSKLPSCRDIQVAVNPYAAGC